MANPNNVMIRTSKATDEELNQFNAWCEVCGAQKTYGEMLHDIENDIICCNTEGCWTTRLDNTQEETMETTFEMEGFNHISGEGIADYWKFLHTHGTIDLLWSIAPKAKINEIMQSSDFDMDAHIKTNYGDADYDEVCADMHDELLETINILDYCFIYNIYNIDFKGRTLRNLDKLPEGDTWAPETYYPMSAGTVFTGYDEFALYCSNATVDGEITVTVNTNEPDDDDGNGHVPQSFNWRITGAMDCNTLGDVVDALHKAGYVRTTYTLL